jgi:mono/diheme cytochrome c family protein
MKRLVKVAGSALVAIVICSAIAATLIPSLSERKRHRLIDVPVAAISFHVDDDVLARGKYLFATRGCGDCHGKDGEGHHVIKDDAGGLLIKAPSIAPGGIADAYADADWARLLRHGVKPTHQPVFIMPSEDYAAFTDEDVAAIASYTRSLKPMPAVAATFELPLLLNALYVVGVVKDAAEKIDHTQAPVVTIEQAVSPAYGAYLARTCTGCHGQGLAGGKIPGTPPSWPPAANLTTAPDSGMHPYRSREQFRQMMRSGKRPDGTAVSTVMPFKSLRHMNDLELDALFEFLKSTAPKASGTR